MPKINIKFFYIHILDVKVIFKFYLVSCNYIISADCSLRISFFNFIF